jgi:hypothetical protein
MQASRTEERKAHNDYSVLGIFCFILGGYVISIWATFLVWEILKAPIDIGIFATYWGLVGALGFGIVGLGTRLIAR